MTLQENQKKAAGFLQRFAAETIPNRINGKDIEGGLGTFETHSPIDDSRLASVARASAADVDAAAQAANAAFADWAALPGKERKKLMHAIADAIVERADEIALLECVDTGQAFRFMSKAALRGAENFRFFADMAESARDGKSIYTPTQTNITGRFPIGPVGVITPWNTPFMLSTWKIAPALAAGCTVVHKPAELSPITARLLLEVAESAGLPPGVWNNVNGFGEDTGKAVTEHPLLKAVAFVGESQTGSHIMRQGADTLKRVHFELGGKNPIVVFDDADLERAADAAVFMIYSLNGERCTSSSRLLVEESIHDKFIEMVKHKASNIKVGHPLDPDTVIGPLINNEHYDKVRSYVDLAKQEGAVVFEGSQSCGPNQIAPVLFSQANNSMRVAQEEIFGPVLTAIPFRDEDDALTLANDIAYGLAGYVWTSDLTRAMRFTSQMNTGMVWVNSENVRHLPTPFGGTKASGIGRDGGDWSFDFYMETRNVSFATSEHRVPKLGG